MDWTLFVFTGTLMIIASGGFAGLCLFKSTTRPRGIAPRPGRAQAPPAHRSESEEIKHALELHIEALVLLVQTLRPQEEGPSTVSLLQARLAGLIWMAPRSAIIKGWRELEGAALLGLQHCDLGHYPAARLNSMEILELLRDHSILDPQQLELYGNLERTRDMAFSFTNSQIPPRYATAFVDGADLLLKDLHAFHQALLHGRASEVAGTTAG